MQNTLQTTSKNLYNHVNKSENKKIGKNQPKRHTVTVRFCSETYNQVQRIKEIQNYNSDAETVRRISREGLLQTKSQRDLILSLIRQLKQSRETEQQIKALKILERNLEEAEIEVNNYDR